MIAGQLSDAGVPVFIADVKGDLSLTGTLGAPVRATVESFGPVLLAKVLDLDETQTTVITLVFRFCDDRELSLLDWPTSGPRCGSSARMRASRCSSSAGAYRRPRSGSSCDRS